MYWFCHTPTWIRHTCFLGIYTCSPSWTLLPPPSLYHPSGPFQCTRPKHPVSCIKLDWWFVSHMIIYMFQCHSPKSFHPRPLSQSPKDYTSVPLLLSHIQGYHYHLSKLHIYALLYCIGVFLTYFTLYNRLQFKTYYYYYHSTGKKILFLKSLNVDYIYYSLTFFPLKGWLLYKKRRQVMIG